MVNMKDKINLKTIVYDDSITVYWDKVYRLQEDFMYEIFLNDILVGETKKTHFTLVNLYPETWYEIHVKVKYYGEKFAFSENLTVETSARKEVIDITKSPYYAIGDGVTMNTKAIQKAIDDCKENQCVFVPSGIFVIGALKLHSNMELFLAEGAILQGTENSADYLPLIRSRFEGVERECYSSLLNMGDLDHGATYNCSNIVIRGKGIIASGGRKLAEIIIAEENERLKEYLKSLGNKIKEYEKPETIAGRIRPRLINMSNCENIVLSGITFKNGASWNIHMIYSNNIITHDCLVYSKGIWNGDGWDPDSSTNCTIFNCRFDTHDDCIAIKSGKNPEGNEINKPCEKINIFDITVINGHGIAIGSEISGGINDINIWDCDLSNTIFGLEIKGTRKRGAYVKNVTVSDFIAPRVHMHSVPYNDDGVGAKTPPKFSDCKFEDVFIIGKYCDYDGNMHECKGIELIGFGEENKIENVIFRNVKLGKNQNITLEYCENITLENITCTENSAG